MTEPLHHYPQIDDLLVLVQTAESGSLSAAARELGLAQPNASRALRRLERRLGVRLFTRGARGSVPTSNGALVIDWARDVVEANRQLLLATAALSQPASAPLRVAASQTIAEELLPGWLAAFRRSQPDVEISLTVANSTEVGRLVGEDVLGFIESPELPGTLPAGASSRTVAADRLVVVVSADHEWARRTRPVSFAEFIATPLVVRELGSGTRVSLEQAVVGRGQLAAPALELASNAAVRVAVAAGAGPAALSELAVRSAVSSGVLRAVMVDGLEVERPLRAVWIGEPSPATKRLIELAEQPIRAAS
jgi:DNA-binding transcriptional LysR family regulator